MRYTGPKNRIARRENMDLGLKTPGSKSQANLLKKISLLPGQHGSQGRRKVSEHAQQLREKQKMRFMYGVTERQMKNYFAKAIARTGNTGLYLTRFLEKRLDTIVYRLGFAPTRAAARQLITHKHITLNDTMLNVPSHQVRIGDVVKIAKESSAKIPAIATSLEKKDLIIPEWLERQGTAGSLKAEPNTESIAQQINIRLVIEFYSR